MEIPHSIKKKKKKERKKERKKRKEKGKGESLITQAIYVNEEVSEKGRVGKAKLNWWGEGSKREIT